MEQFKDLIFKLAETHPNAPLKPAARTLLGERLNQFVSQYQTPDHPPYSAMIEKALRELNEKKGSSEKSISQFLEKVYDGLPLAHSVLLKHHLGKLCESGDIVVACGKRYMLAGEIPSPNLSKKLKKKWQKRKCQDLVTKRDKQRRKRKYFIKRNQEKDGEVAVNHKCKESNERRQNLTEIGVHIEDEHEIERFLSHEDGESGVCGSLSEIKKDIVGDASTQELQKTKQYLYAPHEVSTPERPPGFELIEFENLIHSKSAVEGITELGRAVRQQNRWSRRLSNMKLLTITCGEQNMTHDQEMHAGKRQSEALEIDMLHTAVPVTNHDDFKGIQIYSRRRRKISKQPEINVIDEPSTEMDSTSSPPILNHQELPLKKDGENKELPHQALPNEEDSLRREHLYGNQRVHDVNKDANFTSISKISVHSQAKLYQEQPKCPRGTRKHQQIVAAEDVEKSVDEHDRTDLVQLEQPKKQQCQRRSARILRLSANIY